MGKNFKRVTGLKYITKFTLKDKKERLFTFMHNIDKLDNKNKKLYEKALSYASKHDIEYRNKKKGVKRSETSRKKLKNYEKNINNLFNKLKNIDIITEGDTRKFKKNIFNIKKESGIEFFEKQGFSYVKTQNYVSYGKINNYDKFVEEMNTSLLTKDKKYYNHLQVYYNEITWTEYEDWNDRFRRSIGISSDISKEVFDEWIERYFGGR